MSALEVFDRPSVLRILHGFNPWWSGREMNVPRLKRRAYQECRDTLRDVRGQRVVLLTGPRGVGKTTILRQLANDWIVAGNNPRAVLYAPLEHPVFRLLPLPEIMSIYREMVLPGNEPALLLLEELHYAKEWDTHVKPLLNDEPEYRIVATESVRIIERSLVRETQLGRWVTVPTPTFSFYEYLHVQGIAPDLDPADADIRGLPEVPQERLDRLAAALRPLAPEFRRYLLMGGFPETIAPRDVADAQRLLRENVMERILRRDMALIFGVRNVDDLERLFMYLCLRTGEIFRVKRYADQIKTSPITVANHLELLEQCHLIRRLSPVEIGGRPVQKPRYRIHLVDASLRNAALLRGDEIFADPVETAAVSEAALLRHVVAFQRRHLSRTVYWRDARSGRSADLVLQGDGETLPFQMLAPNAPPPARRQGYVEYSRSEGLPLAYAVSSGETPITTCRVPDLDTRFLRIPAYALCYLLGLAEHGSG